MGYPIYDVSVRTSQVTAGQVMCALLPQAAAAGTGRPARLRQIAICNTTTTAFGVGIGIAGGAGATPGGAAAPVRRGPSTYDPPASTANLYTTYATQPAVPTNYSARLWVPGGSMVVWYYNDGEELVVMPAATPIPFCIWNISTGQVSDVTISFEE